MITVRDLYKKGVILLKGFPHPELEAKVLLCESAGIPEEQFYSAPEKKLTPEQERAYERFLLKRCSGFPLAYVTGRKEFWSIPLRVVPGVLIPRPETELLVQSVVELSSKGKEIIADIGTGCGAVAIALAKELPLATIIATDISRKALRVARLNALSSGNSRIRFIPGSVFAPLEKAHLEGKCDFVVCNPPYVSQGEWENLHKEVRNFEPKKALVAGKTGFEFICRLVEGAPLFLKSGGYLVFEIGAGQKEGVTAFFGKKWKQVQCAPDLNGVGRIVKAQLA